MRNPLTGVLRGFRAVGVRRRVGRLAGSSRLVVGGCGWDVRGWPLGERLRGVRLPWLWRPL
ncbi:hypothetical protein [Nonomuraea longicatena]|uniref:hypothetical protein n=1 Tax=Nonomuraea longicatena TaxID=83682 RepID=UPI0031DEED5C